MTITASTTATPAFEAHDAVSMLEELLDLDRRSAAHVLTFTPSEVALTGSGSDRPTSGRWVEVHTTATHSSFTDLIVEVHAVDSDLVCEDGTAPVLGRFRLTVEKVEADA